ncbi:DNA replication factor Cdt1 [Coccinella septempunctata]|uniref:DNA replication factor Cdt1 n=1 Tax=Coccinella septempunctata TaxID=41139 RepID=UPI001D08182C|nr:DNA replication factor Cdt1 [Coccinella septempunctata]
MAQPSVAAYFTTRKRVAIDELKTNRARKVLIVDEGEGRLSAKRSVENEGSENKKIEIKEHSEESSEVEKVVPNKIVTKTERTQMTRKKSASRRRPSATVKGQQDIHTFVNLVPVSEEISGQTGSDINHVTPPSSPMKIRNGMDKVHEKPKDASLNSMKLKLGRSSRLAELKASLSRFGDLQNKLKEVEKVTSKISVNPPQSPKLQNFKAIELEVQLSPQKIVSPQKLYLSPKKDLTARKNLLNLLSPTKNTVAYSKSPSKTIEDETSKPALTLPFKYRYVAEMFRAIDTVSQLLYNRKETITLSKLKPAVENMTKRNLSNRCLAQIKKIYPEAFKYHQEKLRVFGSGKREEKWELVITPLIGGADHINSDTLLARRRVLFSILLDKVKDYHHEFLMSLEPPMVIPKNQVKRWHPEFDIERVPDIEEDNLPEPPVEMKMTSGQDVLEKAREMFGCNARMEQALERLKAKKEEKATETIPDNTPPPSILKGIPKSLLEKVRQRQAAKALISMTRSVDKEQELKIYSRLPELARLTKNLFVSEKKSVLKMDDVVEKLGNCYRISLTKTEMEEHIKLLVKELPEWLVLHQSLSKVWFLKQLNRDADVNLMRNKLEMILKAKSDQCSA